MKQLIKAYAHLRADVALSVFRQVRDAALLSPLPSLARDFVAAYAAGMVVQLPGVAAAGAATFIAGPVAGRAAYRAFAVLNIVALPWYVKRVVASLESDAFAPTDTATADSFTFISYAPAGAVA
jgi:hypothetical protein